MRLLVAGFGEEQAERALELLTPLVVADAQPGQRVRALPAFVGIADSGRGDISGLVDNLLAEPRGRSRLPDSTGAGPA